MKHPTWDCGGMAGGPQEFDPAQLRGAPTLEPLTFNKLRAEIDHMENGVPFVAISDGWTEVTMGMAEAAALRDWLDRASVRVDASHD